MTQPFIPPATAEKLAQEHPKGTRHKAKMDIALPLIGNGIPPAAVAATLRSKFPEASDHEIDGVVRWAVAQNPTPSGFGFNGGQSYTPRKTADAPPRPRDPLEHIKWWLAGENTPEGILERLSPIPIPPDMREQAKLAFSTLYAPSDCVNLVRRFISDDKGKARPTGGGKTLPAADWIRWIDEKGIPESEAGAWQRMNPVKPVGTGADGSFVDADVTEFRYMLLESDTLPPEIQLRFFIRIKLPVAVILLSGGKSAHAWVRLNAPTADAYESAVKRIIDALKPFGFDAANKNPSRLSRMVGAKREIGAAGDGLQKLLWITHPQTESISEETLSKFEAQLAIPDVPDMPMQAVVSHAGDRYAELIQNQGKLGIPTGITEFDQRTGGLKGGQMSVVAALTNGGKSTFALNIVNHALTQGHGVALFTLEMDRDEIVDLLFAMNGPIDRNVFNTGVFLQQDIQRINIQGEKIKRFPLWIFDDARLTVAEMVKRVKAIRERIGLVVIDYVQIISPDDPREQREQQVATIARELRILAKETKLPFVVLSQLNDEGKIRESRVVAHEAHNVIMLETNDEQTQMEVKIVKGRQIRRESYLLNYRPEYCRIENRPFLSV